MCMSYDHPKPIRMHALTLFNGMRRPKLPQRPRGSPGAFTFFKIFEHTGTNQYIFLSAGKFCAARVGRAQGASARCANSNPCTELAVRRRLTATLCRANLCHQTFLGILCHPEFFSGRSVSPEWQPYLGRSKVWFQISNIASLLWWGVPQYHSELSAEPCHQDICMPEKNSHSDLAVPQQQNDEFPCLFLFERNGPLYNSNASLDCC